MLIPTVQGLSELHSLASARPRTRKLLMRQVTVSVWLWIRHRADKLRVCDSLHARRVAAVSRSDRRGESDCRCSEIVISMYYSLVPRWLWYVQASLLAFEALWKAVCVQSSGILDGTLSDDLYTTKQYILYIIHWILLQVFI